MAGGKALGSPQLWTECLGRNGVDPPHTVPADRAVEMMNMSVVGKTLGRKRSGSETQAITGTFDGFNVLARFVPGQSDLAAELHFVDRSGTSKIMRVAAGTAAVSLTLDDAIASLPQDARWAVINGKLYWAYDSTVNRLHVYDPVDGLVRRVGTARPAAPTAANTGAGTYAATARYYRVRWLVVRSGRVQRQSNPGPSVAFTPSGTGSAARVTRPSAPAAAEYVTHWIVEGSDDDADYYDLSAAIAIATTTYDDAVLPSAYGDNTASPVAGANTPPPSSKFILSTGDRLLFYGVYEASSAAGDAVVPEPGRLYYTPVLGTSDISGIGPDDDERVSVTPTYKGYIDVSRNANSEDRALAGPVDGMIFTFQSNSFRLFNRTGDASAPYVKVDLDSTTSAHGAVSQESTFVGEDENGQACVYFLDPLRGPYRYGGSAGLVWCGYEVQDVWARVNLEATGRAAVGLYDTSTRTVKFCLAVDGANDPNLAIVLHVEHGQMTSEGLKGGWVVWTGDATSGRSMVMFSETFGATMSRRLKPYVGRSTNSLLRTEVETAEQDGTTSYRGYVTSRAFANIPYVNTKTIAKTWIQAATECCGQIHQTLIADFGAREATAEPVSIQPIEGQASRVIKWFSDAYLAEFFTFQVQLGDLRDVKGLWWIDLWVGTLNETAGEVGNA